MEEIEEEEEDLFAMMFDEEDDFDREILKYLITEEPVISLFEITKKIVDEINSDETKEFLEKSSDLVDQLEGEENDSLVPTSKQIELRSSIARKAAKGFKVEGLKGSNLLSESEKKLCTELKLSPMDYIKYKTLIIKVSVLPLCHPSLVASFLFLHSIGVRNHRNHRKSKTIPIYLHHQSWPNFSISTRRMRTLFEKFPNISSRLELVTRND